jgi:hypothetical protein
VERVLIYLAIVAAVSMVLAALFTKPHRVAVEACADVRAFARDVQVAFMTRAAPRGTYYFPYPVVVNSTGVYCRECLVSVSAATANSTVLTGRQRLLIDASSGAVVLRRLP